MGSRQNVIKQMKEIMQADLEQNEVWSNRVFDVLKVMHRLSHIDLQIAYSLNLFLFWEMLRH